MTDNIDKTNLKSLNTASKEVNQKFNQETWLSTEQRLSTFDLQVLNMLSSVGNGTEYIHNEVKLKVMGDSLYKLIRSDINTKDMQLVNNENIEEDKKKKSKKNKSKISKRDMIRLQNAQSNIKTEIKKIIESFDTTKYNARLAFHSQILEIRGIAFLYSLWFLLNNKNKYKKEKYLQFTLSIIVATERFINICEQYQGRDMIVPSSSCNISTILFQDINKLFKKVKRTFPFDGFTIYDHAPELLIYTDYDKFIPSKGIQLRKNQKDVIEFVHKNFENGFVLSYHAMISSGKTTCSVALIKYMEKMKKLNEKYEHLQFIFCCNLASVKTQVAQYCYNMDIPFAIGHKHHNGGAKITNNYNCQSEKDRLVIICSPDVAHILLTDRSYDDSKGKPQDRYFMFLDEPTIGADNINSIAIKDNMKVMSNMPKWTVLSSATMPELSKLSNILDDYKKEQPNSNINTVYSNEIQIGCDVFTNNLEPVVPHLSCKTQKELKIIINTIMKNPFLGRIYTHNVARKLYFQCIENNIPGIPDIPNIFKCIENLSFNKVREQVMTMLNILSEQENLIIEKVCSSNIFKDDEDSSESEDEDSNDGGFDWDTGETEQCDKGNIDYTKIGTTQAYRFLNMNLVATTIPFEFTMDSFKPLLEELKKDGITSATHLISKYQKELQAHNATRERLIKKVESEDKLTKQLQELEDNKPFIKFPSYGHINTKEHILKFSPGAKSNINSKFIRFQLSIESLPVDSFRIPDEILLLLFCGIGIYSPGHKMLNNNYTNTILNLASNNELAFIIADNSICYGTNYPINRVFITKEFSNEHSIFTIFQLMGRAGRVGRSWKAEAYIDNTCAKNIIEYTSNPNKYDNEA